MGAPPWAPGSATATEEESRHSAPSLGAQATTFFNDVSQPEVDFSYSWAMLLSNFSGKLSV